MPRLTDITEAEESELALEFAESIHAGFPSPAADHTGERINLTRCLTPNPETTFYAHIEGDFIVAYIDGEYTVKEFQLDPTGKCAWLIPHNPAFPKIQVTADNNFSVWGVVTYAIHKTHK